MKVTVCQCRKCGRFHVFEKYETRDIHVCECGERIERWTYRMDTCETGKGPNKPHEKKCKPIRNDMLDAMTYAFCIHNEEATQKRSCKEEHWEKANPAFAFIDNNQKVNVIPIITVDTKALIFQSDVLLTTNCKKELEKEYTERTGIECIILDGKAKFAAVIDG